MSKWLRNLALCFLGLILASVLVPPLVRALAPLPSIEDRPGSRAYTDTAGTPLGKAIVPATKAHPGLSGIHLLPGSRDAFAARVALARAVTLSIDAQYYIWHDDLTGGLLFDELLAAADRGVRVRLLLDDNNTVGLDRRIAQLDAHPEIEVRLFNPFVVREPRLLGYLTDFSRLNRRMHNKSFTADNQATIVGGRNIGDEYFGAGDEALFVDVDVLAIGPVASAVSSDFDNYWASGSSYPARRIVDAPAKARRAGPEHITALTKDSRASLYLDAARDLPLARQLVEGRIAFEWARTLLVSDDPAKGLGRTTRDDLLFTQLQEIIGEPKNLIGLVSGYFVPGEAGTRAFADLRARGVEVTILTNAFEATDVRLVHAGYVKWRKPLLKAGVRLFEMRGSGGGAGPVRSPRAGGSNGSRLGGAGKALHAKTFAVDGRRLFVGSFNFDPRSARLNTELGLVIDSARLAGRLHSALASRAPAQTYEVRLSDAGEVYWIDRRNGKEIRHDTEPGTTRWQRAAVALLSWLPIDWLL